MNPERLVISDQPTATPNGPVTDAAWLQAWTAAFDQGPSYSISAGDAGLTLFSRPKGPAGLLRALAGPTNGQSQYAGLVLSPSDPVGSAAALLRAATARKGWDVLHLQGVSQADCAPLAQAAASSGLTLQVERSFFHYIADLAAIRAGTAPPLMSGDTRRRKERQFRALERTGSVTFSRATGEDCHAALKLYLQAERASWKAESGELLSSNAQISRFYHLVATLPGTEIWLMHLDSRPIAGLVLRCVAGELVCLKTFYDRALDAFSPGALTVIHILRHSLQDPHVSRVNFFSGKESYRSLSTGQIDLCDLIIWGPGHRAALLRRMRGLLHWLRTKNSPPVISKKVSA